MNQPTKYLQHPKAIGLKVVSCERQSEKSESMPVGLILNTQTEFETSASVRISHPRLCPETQIEAQVIWCRRQSSGFQLAVQFRTEADLYRVRLLEQLCHIKLYQVEKQRLGESISFDTAAQEWIEQYAAHFPTDGL